jgi:glycosyltransferase involved in cell wall biosynthesis
MSDPRRTVCFVVPSLDGGGAERVAVSVLNALDPQRWDRSLYLFEPRGPYLADVSPSIRVESGRAASRVGRWREIRRFFRSRRPDLVVAFLSYFSVLTAARAAGARSRIVFAVGTPVSAFLADADYRWSRPWMRRMFATSMRRALSAADLIVATSSGVADDLVRTYGARSARVSVVPNPVDLEAIARSAEEPLDDAIAARWRRPVVVAAGRLAEAKNYPLLIAAFAKLRETVPASLFILGGGEQESALRDDIRARGLDAVVHLVGFQRNPWKFIARADVFALTSRYEGFGNVLVESMACGVPVVATSSPGTRDIVSDGVDGILVQRHDASEVAAAIARVLSDPPFHARLAAAAKGKANAYETRAVAGAYDRAFVEALA